MYENFLPHFLRKQLINYATHTCKMHKLTSQMILKVLYKVDFEKKKEIIPVVTSVVVLVTSTWSLRVPATVASDQSERCNSLSQHFCLSYPQSSVLCLVEDAGMKVSGSNPSSATHTSQPLFSILWYICPYFFKISNLSDNWGIGCQTILTHSNF